MTNHPETPKHGSYKGKKVIQDGSHWIKGQISFLINAFKQKSLQYVIPARLQAYERICLLLERANPSNLILRVNQQGFSASDLQQVMLREIREEFSHNYSQQVYMSEQSWVFVKEVLEEINTIINMAAEKLPAEASSFDLAIQITAIVQEKGHEPTAPVLQFIKEEIRQIF